MTAKNLTAISRCLYYQLKPWLPRRIAIELRKGLTALKLRRHRATWPIDDTTASPLQSWIGWPYGKSFALVLTHDVETARGLQNVLKIAQMEENLGFRSSWNLVPHKYRIDDGVVRELQAEDAGARRELRH